MAIHTSDAKYTTLGVERTQPPARAFLVRFHQPAVADNIGGKDRSKSALDTFGRHVILQVWERRTC